MNSREIADRSVSAYLRSLEREMDNFESALPENKGRAPHRLTVTKVLESELLWLYFYDSETFAKTAQFRDAFAGGAPIIVDRSDGKLYSTGTAFAVEHYIQEFLSGIRRPIEV